MTLKNWSNIKMTKKEYYKKYLFYYNSIKFNNAKYFIKDFKELIKDFKKKYNKDINYFIAKKGI